MNADPITWLPVLLVAHVAWLIVFMLPAGLFFILVALGIRLLNRLVKALEQRSFESGAGGFGKMVWDDLRLILIVGALFLGCIFLGPGLLNLVQPEVEKLAELPTQPLSLNSILLLALIIGGPLAVLGVRAYHSLRQQAAELAESFENQEGPRPLLVKLFHDSKGLGLLVVIICGYILFGMLLQTVGFLANLLPLPRILTEPSVPFTETNLIWIALVLLVLTILLLLAFYGFTVWMGWRALKLDIRYYQENPVFRMRVNILATIYGAASGMLLSMHLLNYLGQIYWPDIFH